MERRLTIDCRADGAPGGCVVLHVAGTLDASTYRHMRDSIIKAALDTPRAVIVDVDAMDVSTSSALTAFTSARWHVSHWPDVPIMVVTGDAALQRSFVRLGVSDYVPVYATIAAATAAVSTREYRYRRRVVVDLQGGEPITRAHAFVDERLKAWDLSDRRLAVRTVVSALVENAVTHGRRGCALRLETDGDVVIVAVSDENSALAVRHEPDAANPRLRGLDLVAALSRSWHNSPTGTGKTVSAIIGPENGINDLAKFIDDAGR